MVDRRSDDFCAPRPGHEDADGELLDRIKRALAANPGAYAETITSIIYREMRRDGLTVPAKLPELVGDLCAPRWGA